MPLPLRKYYGNQLVAAKKKEKEEIERATKKSSGISRPTFQKS